jgi:hypothetical protein
MLGYQRMNFYQSYRGLFTVLIDWLGLMLMSLTAPVIAYFVLVFYCCLRFDADTNFPWLLAGFVFCPLPAIPTFLVLLPFRRRVLYRWIIWTGFIFLWTSLLFAFQGWWA